jgi:lipoprotein-anchoring transpeptidase ErfK/SrfK
MLPLILHRQPRVAALIAAMMIAADAAAQTCDEEPRPERRLIVSLADRKLALVENGEVVKLYNVAIGAKRSPTPAGEYRIVNRIPDPTWYGPRQIVGPGKHNPLGTRWMGLSLKGYGIHGTNNPRSIGRMASHGCIRMRNADVEDLFNRVSVGDSVELLAQPDAGSARWFRPAETVAD